MRSKVFEVFEHHVAGAGPEKRAEPEIENDQVIQLSDYGKHDVVD